MPNSASPFIGRQDAIDLFYRIQSAEEPATCLYVQAPGGIGKTRLLRELMAKCDDAQLQLRPPGSNIDPLIDFSALENRSIAGLRHSIIARLGEEGFADFRASETELRAAEAAFLKNPSDSALSSNIFALRRRNDAVFLDGFRKSQRGRRTALFFDTFEIAYRRRVGRWFIDQFIANSEGCLIVFAGRPPVTPAPFRKQSVTLPSNVLFHELFPWNGAEVNKYFAERNWEDPAGQEGMLHLRRVTGGRPLLVDMMIYLRDASLMPAEDLPALPDPQGNESISPELEIALVRRLLSVQSDEQAIIMEMAYLKRRFDADIFQTRQRDAAYGTVTDFAQFVEKLLKSPYSAREGLSSIVKYRTGDSVLTLHDEAQRMIEEHAQDVNGLWEPMCEELYQQIVRTWYDQAIKREGMNETKYILKAEQLGYELEHNLDKGIELYNEYSKEIRKKLLFEFNELIWGEVADKIAQNRLSGREYDLIYDQADWLWFVGQYDAAADLALLLTEGYTQEPSQVFLRLDALALLGHTYMHNRKYDEAQRAFDNGLKEAQKADSKTWISAFQQNMGQLLQLTNRWDQARELFRMAVRTAREVDEREAQALAVDEREAQALAFVNLGQLQGLIGEYNQAILNCKRAVALRSKVLNDFKKLMEARRKEQRDFHAIPHDKGSYYTEEGAKSRVGVAHLRLADVYRYSGELQKARDHYDRALDSFKVLHQFNYESEARQGLGALALDLSAQQRKASDWRASAEALDLAFDQFERAITLCREYGFRELLPRALHRFAHAVLLLGELEAVAALRGDEQLNALSKRISGFLLPEGEGWPRDSRRLRESAPFAELSTVAKAQRMFEVSSLEAGRSHDVNTMIDSLVEACKIALDRGRFDDVRAYALRAQAPNESYQKRIFLALIEIVLADLDLIEGRNEDAFGRYSVNFPILAETPGYGSYLLRNYLDRFILRLQSLSRDQGSSLAKRLIQTWIEQNLDDSHPELFFQLYNYLDQA